MTTLGAVKTYLERHGRSALPEIAGALGTTPDNARHLLELWRAKDRVRLIPARCGGCGKGPFGGDCALAALIPDVYEWVGKDEGGGHAA